MENFGGERPMNWMVKTLNTTSLLELKSRWKKKVIKRVSFYTSIIVKKTPKPIKEYLQGCCICSCHKHALKLGQVVKYNLPKTYNAFHWISILICPWVLPVEKSILRSVWISEIERTNKVCGLIAAFMSSPCTQNLQIGEWMNITVNNPEDGGTSLLIKFMRDTEAGKWWVPITTESMLQWVLKLEI